MKLHPTFVIEHSAPAPAGVAGKKLFFPLHPPFPLFQRKNVPYNCTGSKLVKIKFIVPEGFLYFKRIFIKKVD
jgi:hypothetical protein